MLLDGPEPHLSCWQSLAQATARSWPQALLLINESPELLESVVDVLQVLQNAGFRLFRGCFQWLLEVFDAVRARFGRISGGRLAWQFL